MRTLTNWFSWLNPSSTSELPNIFPFPYLERDFVSTDVTNIYSRILTDVLERTDGIPDEQKNLLWDNCLASESQDGLVTMLSKAMTDKKDLFLIYDRALKLIRKANNTEESVIRADYKNQGQSSTGIFITFKNYGRTDMVKIYSALDYCSVASLSKSMNLSKAIQIKLTSLRSGVSSIDSVDVKAQGVALAQGLASGKDIMIDEKDMIETAKPDLTATQSAMEMNAKKMSLYLGLPASYITGEGKNSMGDTGEGDAKAVERGLKGYYFSIIKPVIELIFDVKTTFKTEDFRQISSSLEVLKTFELVSDELISPENKLDVINKLFGFPEGTKGGPVETPPEPVRVPAVPEPPQRP